MKGILKTNITTSNGEFIQQGTKVEIINGWFGCDGYEYQCVLPDKRMFVISYSSVEITDNSPYVNWEQRRYEIARECLAALAQGKSNIDQDRLASIAVYMAKKLIEQLKGQ